MKRDKKKLLKKCPNQKNILPYKIHIINSFEIVFLRFIYLYLSSIYNKLK